MRNIDLMREIATLAGYTIDAATGQDPANKVRAQRRLNSVKSDVISRYGGRWPSNYREGWLPLVPLYNTGTVTYTQGSRTVVGIGTAWDSTYNGAKILLADGAYYKIASVTSSTVIVLTQPAQGPSNGGTSYQIWVDEYTLHPEVLSVGGFLDYEGGATMDEAWPRNMKQSYPVPTDAELPTVFTVIGRKGNVGTYSTGLVSGTAGDNTLTGSGTAWMGNIYPGYEILINSVYYHVKSVNSDSSIELYQRFPAAINNLTYAARGKNGLIVRFRKPTTQKIVHYWYWAKDYPFVCDSDEDWVAEAYSEVLISGAVNKDYLDKNDVARASLSKQVYEDNIKNMKVSEENAMSGPRTLGYNIPPEARD